MGKGIMIKKLRKQQASQKSRRRLKVTAAVLLSAAVVLAGILCGIRLYGEKHLKEHPTVEGIGGGEGVINILCLGIDKEEIMSERDDDGNSIGQSDAVFLMSVDPSAERLRLVAIPRDTMVLVEYCDEQGNYMGAGRAQLALQYAYSDGGEKSCGLVAGRVSNLLGGIPIHGCVAVNLSCIPVMNDAVGGVSVTMDEDYTLYNPAFEKGASVRLFGEAAVNYVQGRDIREPGSAYTRISRQKQYLTAFWGQAKQAFAKDALLPVKMMKRLQENMATDLDAAEVLYLAGAAASCEFSEEDMYILPGEIRQNGNYEEYVVDADAAEELAQSLFYLQTEDEGWIDSTEKCR